MQHWAQGQSRALNYAHSHCLLVRCGCVEPAVVGSGRSGCRGGVVPSGSAWDGLFEAVNMESGQPRSTHVKTLPGLQPALGHALTLCYPSTASAQPTPTHIWLGTLQEQQKEPRDNRDTYRSSVPFRLGLPAAIVPTLT